MTPLFPVPPDTKIVHDLKIIPRFYDEIPTYVKDIPLTRSMTFAIGTTERDSEMPECANTIQEAHRKKHGMPINSMSFVLAASPSDPDDPRSTQLQIELARSLRRQGLLGPSGLSKIRVDRLERSQRPLDVSCLTDPELPRAYAGLSLLSLTVEPSEDEQPWPSVPILPKSLQTLNLRYSHHYNHPCELYKSRLAEKISGSHATKVTFSCDEPGICGCDGHHG